MRAVTFNDGRTSEARKRANRNYYIRNRDRLKANALRKYHESKRNDYGPHPAQNATPLPVAAGLGATFRRAA